MSKQFNEWVQSRLVEHGYSIDVDGLFGGETRRALLAFQRAKHLAQTSTTTPETVRALRLDVLGRDAGGTKAKVRPLWLAELERRMRLHETRDRSALMAWLRSDGKTLGDPEKLPWCGDAIDTAIALTLPDEPHVVNPYLARNWLKFGAACPPRLGAVMVFWRGSRKGTSGHVALYVGEDATHYHVIGGNQSDAITVTRIAKDRLLGARWPVTSKLNTDAVQLAASGAISTNEA